MPNLDPKLMKAAMKRLGIKQEEIAASEVIIKTSNGYIIVRNPNVTKVTMGGEESFQITGEIQEQPFSDEDARTVAAQAAVSEEEAREALKETNGDLAEAIMKLKKE